MKEVNKSAIFVIPRSSYAWRGNEAGWITASGWASAAEELWGHALVSTTDGVFTSKESILFPRVQANKEIVQKKINPFFRKLIPEFLITGIKDIQLMLSKPKIWPIENTLSKSEYNVKMVWERHDLFPGNGYKIAKRLKVPFVISVEAAVVWEARKWGIKRPFWGNFLEKFGEANAMKKADLVLCVSEQLKHKLSQMGIAPEKIMVSHNRVNGTLFNPYVIGDVIRKKYRIGNKRIIGWTGSFRSFHGLNSVIHGFKKLSNKYDDIILMLVGDGLERQKTEQLVSDLSLQGRVIFTGKQDFVNIPEFIGAFDIGLVSASSSEDFHYSPLKLREYLACGKPTIVPNAGDLPSLFTDKKEVLFYEAGDAHDLSVKMAQLLSNHNLQLAMKKNAIELFINEGTWVHELKKVCDRLGIDY